MNPTDRPENGPNPEPDDPPVAELVDQLVQHATDMSRHAGGRSGTIRMAAGGVSVESSWGSATVTAADEDHAPPAAPVRADTTDDTGHRICAQTVGVFYAAPEPGAPPFVQQGDVITVGQQVAITEAMKLMIPVEADRAGRVREVLVADGTPVEHGQPLLLLDPAPEKVGAS